MFGPVPISIKFGTQHFFLHISETNIGFKVKSTRVISYSQII